MVFPSNNWEFQDLHSTTEGTFSQKDCDSISKAVVAFSRHGSSGKGPGDEWMLHLLVTYDRVQDESVHDEESFSSDPASQALCRAILRGLPREVRRKLEEGIGRTKRRGPLPPG